MKCPAVERAQTTARYNGRMARALEVFDSFSKAESASRAQYAAMTPEERLALVLELSRREREDHGEASARLARVYRVTELERR